MAWLPARGDSLQPGPLQGAAARRGSSPQGPVGSGQPCRQQGWWRRSQGWPPLGRAVASRFLRKGNDDNGAVRVKEG
ncbi:hypothetical protein BHE74_00049857 [Ensete ventricosum]|nr:hypothetical protein BHE74_00049857 [Ensete ventricosum]